jgi:hypothetical protein
MKAKAPTPTAPFAWRKILGIGFAAMLAGAIVTFAISQRIHRGLVPPSQQRTTTFHAGLTLGQLQEMTPEQLADVDVAEANLLCARGLPGSENLDVAAKLKQLDTWADRVDIETRRNWHRYKNNPAEYENSEIYYRMGMLVTVLQQDFGVHYNPDLIDVPESKVDEAFLSDPSNMLLTGLLSDHRMGTCSSMPVLYVAIGRRLGYPVTLVSAKDHLFVRWQRSGTSGHENIEGTSRGFTFHPDDYYQNWRGITEADIKSGVHLKSLTPAQELAIFLMTRGGAFQYHKRLPEAAVAYAHAGTLWPENREVKTYLAEIGVKLAPWQFHPMPPKGLFPDTRDVSPIQAIEQANRRLLKQTHPEIDWGVVYQKKFNRNQP